MRHIFLRYFLMFMLSCAVIFSAIIWLESTFDHYAYETTLNTMTRGLLDKLSDDLAGLSPQEQWEMIDAYDQTINLVPISLLELTDEEHQELINDQIVLLGIQRNIDNKVHAYKKIEQQNRAIDLTLSVHDHSQIQNYIDPSLTFIRDNLKQSTDLKQTLKNLKQRYGFDIKLLPLAKLKLNLEQKNYLAANPFIIVYPKPNDISVQKIYLHYDAEHALVIGPISWPLNDKERDQIIFTVLFLLFLIQAFVVAGWMYRNLRKLEQVAEHCAQGNFQLAASIHPSSVLYHIDQSLINMSQKIKQLLENQRVLVQSMSHDVRTPLMRLKFRLYELESKLGSNDPLIKEFQQDINDIDDLLETIFTYIKGNKPELNLQSASITDLLSEHIATHKNNARQIALNLNGEQLPPITLDAFLFERVLQNIFDNALRHAKSYLSIEQEIVANEQVRLIFKNDCSVQQSDQHGWGLGLSIAEKIVQWHNGTLCTNINADGEFIVEILLHTKT